MSSNIITDKELNVTKFWLLRGGVLLISNILQYQLRHKAVPYTSVSGTAQGSGSYFKI